MDSLKKINESICQKTYPDGVIDPATMNIMSSVVVELIKLIHECNKSKLSISVFHAPRMLEKAWLIRRLKELLPSTHKNKYRDIYDSILSSASSMTQKDIDSVVFEIFSIDTHQES